MLPPMPRLNRLDEKSRAEGPQLRVGRVPHATVRQDGTATTKDQRAASGSKELHLFTFGTHHVIESSTLKK